MKLKSVYLMQVMAYNNYMAIQNIFTKQNGNFSRVLDTAPQYSPAGGVGSTSGDYTFTTNGWVKNPTRTITPPSVTPVVTSPRTLPPQPTVSSYTQPEIKNTTTETIKNPYDAFNMLLQGTLKTAQGINTTDLLKQQRALQREAIARTGRTGTGEQPTEEELKFLSPSQQEAMRGADVEALSTGIDEVAYNITKLNQDRKDLIEQIQLAQKSGDNSRAAKLEEEWKQKDYELKEAQLAETKRSNMASEGTNAYKPPTSYQEWQLAGSPGTYADYLKESNTKAPTSAQQTVATYAARIEQSNPILTNLTDKISKMNLLNFETQKRLPSAVQSSEFQQYDQASRNFINAVLRRESGAVISPSEFDNAYQQYLPKPGDSEETLKQKKANRDIVYTSLKNAAGNAYQGVDELLGKNNDPMGIR